VSRWMTTTPHIFPPFVSRGTMTTPLENKSTVAEIRQRFDNDVERFSNLRTGQSATIDAPLAMELITQAAVAASSPISRVLDIGCGAGNNTLRLRQQCGADFDVDLVDLSQPMLDRARERVQLASQGTITIWHEDIRSADLPHESFDVIMAVLGAGTFAAFFFVSGYFVPQAVKKYGAGHYISSRVKMMALPWLAAVILVSPSLTFMRHLAINDNPMDYWQYLQAYVGGIDQFFVGIATDTDRVARHHLWWHHLWFIPNLLLFSVIAAWVLGRKPQYYTLPQTEDQHILRKLLLAGLATFLAFFTLSQWLPDYEFKNVIVFNLFQTHPTRLIVYTVAFAGGIYANLRGWFTQGWQIGKFRYWAIVYILLLIPYLGSFQAIAEYQGNPIPLWLHALQNATVVGLSLAFTVITATFFYRYADKEYRFTYRIQDHAFAIYLIHYPLVVLIQYAINTIAMNLFLKLAVVLVATVIGSYLISRYLWMRSGWLVVAVLVAIQFALIGITQS